MKKTFINQLTPGQKIVDFFYVEEKSLRQSRNGKQYLDLVLRDRTGSISAKVWENAQEVSDKFSREDYVKVMGLVDSFKDSNQLKIDRIRVAGEDEVKPADFLPVSGKDPKEMYIRFNQLLQSIKEPWIKKLLDSFFSDVEFARTFTRKPAAKSVHHVYLGGLLEHTLSVMEICDFLAGHYEDLDRDLLMAGAVLHDIGKVKELDVKGSFEYSMQGELLGHIFIGAIMVRERIAQIEGFPENLAFLIEHLILSHQGKAEFGSVKAPMFKEAIILHYADDMDAKINLVRRFADPEYGNSDGIWTDRCFYLEGRRLLRLEKVWQGEGPSVENQIPDGNRTD